MILIKLIRFLCLIVACVVIVGLEGVAQVKKRINLEIALELGGAKNLTIQNYINRQELALAKVVEAKQWWVPDLYFGFVNHNLYGNAMNDDGRFYEGVKRSSQWLGAGVDAQWDVYAGMYNTSLKEMESEIAALDQKSQKNKVLLEIISAYYDLAVAQMVHHANLEMTLATDSIVKQLEVLIRRGTRNETELLMAKSKFTGLQSALRDSYLAYFKHSKRLAFLLDEKSHVQFVVANDYLVPLAYDNDSVAVGVATSVVYNTSLDKDIEDHKLFEASRQLTLKRPEVEREEKTLELLEMKNDFLRREFLFPKIRLNTYGAGFGGMFSSYHLTNELNFGLMWKLPLARIVMKGEYDVLSRELLMQENEKDLIADKLSKDWLVAEVKVKTSKEGVYFANESYQLAEKAFRQSVQRQGLGLAKPYEILEAQDLLLKAKKNYFTIVGEYNKALFQLKVASGINL